MEQPYWLERYFDQGLQIETYRLRRNGETVLLSDVMSVRPLTVTVKMAAMCRFSQTLTFENLTLDPHQNRSLSRTFDPEPARRSTEWFVPLVFLTEATDGAAIADALLAQTSLAGTRPGPKTHPHRARSYLMAWAEPTRPGPSRSN